MNGEARPAAGAAVFGACRAELAVTVCATGRKRRGGVSDRKLGYVITGKERERRK